MCIMQMKLEARKSDLMYKKKARHFTTYLTIFKLLKRSVYFQDKMKEKKNPRFAKWFLTLYCMMSVHTNKAYSYAVYTVTHCCATLFVILSIQMSYWLSLQTQRSGSVVRYNTDQYKQLCSRTVSGNMFINAQCLSPLRDEMCTIQ